MVFLEIISSQFGESDNPFFFSLVLLIINSSHLFTSVSEYCLSLFISIELWALDFQSIRLIELEYRFNFFIFLGISLFCSSPSLCSILCSTFRNFPCFYYFNFLLSTCRVLLSFTNCVCVFLLVHLSFISILYFISFAPTQYYLGLHFLHISHLYIYYGV